jgi:hypothetical protein
MTAQVRLSPERSSHATRAGEGHVRKPGPAKVAGATRGTPAVADLVARVRDGDQQARDALVERYAPLIWPICRKHRLGHADVGDVAQCLRLQMVNHLDEIRDPAALPGWLATTTGPEYSRPLRAARGPTRPSTRRSQTRMLQPRSKSCCCPNAARRCAKRSGTCARAASS